MRAQEGRRLATMMLMMFCLTLTVPAIGQDVGNHDQSTAAPAQQFGAGRNATVEGSIVNRSADGFTMRDLSGAMIEVNLTDNTEVKERKSNPFRRAKNYGVTQLLRGLDVEVRGHGSNTGTLVADSIRFTQDDFRLASVMDARMNPVENRLSSDENRLGQTEANALKLSGQLSEVSEVSNAARGGAKAAQETANVALDSAKQASDAAQSAKVGVRAANDRITALDDFEAKSTTMVRFKLGSAVLSPEAKEELDKLAEAAKNEKGYVIEVAGFASADGNQELNRALSQHRADGVIRYLAENHSIPLRRFITPFGYGDKMPIADNKTRDGRIQNRRVEVRILVSKGLAQSGAQAVAMN